MDPGGIVVASFPRAAEAEAEADRLRKQAGEAAK
jgi:hypothetical protein